MTAAQPSSYRSRYAPRSALLIAAAVATAGCGGSGDDGGSAAPASSAPAVSTQVTSSEGSGAADAGDDAEDGIDGEGGGVVIAGGDVSVDGSVVASGGTVAGASGGGAIVGSGVVVTESRPLSGFHAVDVRGAGSVQVQMADREAVDVEADDNVLALIHTEVMEGRLVVSLEPGASLRAVTIRVRVQAVQLDAITGAGATNISVEGLAAPALSLGLQGSGDARLRGTATSLAIDVDGSGDVEAAELVAEAATVRIAGSGDVEVHATASLDASIQGSGDITYHGAPPTITTAVDGSGDIEPA